MSLGIVFIALLGLLALFQLALALGAPWGRLAFGGEHEGALPGRLRIAAACTILIYALFAIIALSHLGAIRLLPAPVAGIGIWVVFGILALSALANLLSRSRLERAMMTPIAAVLAILALLIALAGTGGEFEGTVIDSGDGPRLCAVVLESYPPQCGQPTPLLGWEWSGTPHEQANGVRWGDYRFDGVREGGGIRLVGAPSAR